MIILLGVLVPFRVRIFGTGDAVEIYLLVFVTRQILSKTKNTNSVNKWRQDEIPEKSQFQLFMTVFDNISLAIRARPTTFMFF